MSITSSYSTTPKYTVQSTDAQSVQLLVQGITSNIQKIAQNVSQIENMNMSIGTQRDSESLRERLLQTENHTNQLAKETSKQLKELNTYVRNTTANQVNLSSEDRQLKIQKERLTNDLVRTLNKFQEVQKLAMQKQKESNERAKANMHMNQASSGDDSIGLQQIKGRGYDPDLAKELGMVSGQPQNQQQQVQLQMENELSIKQLRDREAALRRLESDIVDVNMIFKDLAVMVHDQGEIIDSIESNVENVQVRVQEANVHLEEAKKHQRRARKKKFILALILASVLFVILLIIFLSLKH